MNFNDNCISKHQKQDNVVSKYFSKDIGMDESLDDFKEGKKINSGPKKVVKPIQRKPRKREKCQRDIRTLIKKNELVKYTKDFDKVCKETGIDLDSEQLQLAIALSKSLHETQNLSADSDPQSSKPLTTQERNNKIRTTLQEYGFKVPDKKISLKINTRKRYKKQYKLLLLTNEEKQQNISDKYAEVLARNILQSPVKNLEQHDYNYDSLYYKTSNIAYEDVKDNEVFYIKKLISKANKTCLLRDWSEIPGRPASPKIEVKNFNFDYFQCSQDQLDCILSSSIKSAQTIIENKSVFDNLTDNTNDKCMEMSSEIIIDKAMENVNKHDESVMKNQSDCLLDLKGRKETKSFEGVRSLSPDLFDDDEVSLVFESTNNPTPDTKNNITQKNQSEYMDLTECINIENQDATKLHVVSETNKTNRKSNDLMEITECVDVKSHSMTKLHVISETNKTKRKTNDFMEITECVPTNTNVLDIQNIDLTQSPDSDIIEDFKDVTEDKEIVNLSHNSDDSLPAVHISGLLKEQSCDSTILLDNDEIKVFKQTPEELKCNDDLHMLNDEHMNDNNIMIKSRSQSPSDVCTKNVSNKCLDIVADKCQSANIDLTQDSKSSIENFEHDNINSPTSRSCGLVKNNESNSCDDNVHGNLSNRDNIDTYNYDDRSDEEEENIDNKYKSTNPYTTEIIKLSNEESDKNVDYEVGSNKESPSYSYTEDVMDNIHKNDCIKSFVDTDKNINNIDLTQDSMSPNEDLPVINSQAFIDSNSLGKKDNISIDYDEIFVDVISSNRNSSISHKSVDIAKNENTLDTESNHDPITFDDDLDINFETNYRTNEDLPSSNKLLSSHNFNITCNENNLQDKEPKDHSTEVESNCSKNSDGFEISDKELNYSINQSKYDNFNLGSISNISFSKFHLKNNSNANIGTNLNRSMSEGDLPFIELKKRSPLKALTSHKIMHSSETSTPMKATKVDLTNIITQTPQNSEYIIKTNEVTPLLDYASMSTPDRNKELEKYGLKSFKRKRAVQLLNHLYIQTHPIVESYIDEECPSPSKKLKKDCIIEKHSSPRKSKSPCSSTLPESYTSDKENNLYAVTHEEPNIRNIECDPVDWVFQKREKAKVHSCRVPLHITFHNYVSCRRLLREAILQYEPINIDVVHKDLVASGYKYNPKDLLRFLDKRCITVKMMDNNARNRKS